MTPLVRDKGERMGVLIIGCVVFALNNGPFTLVEFGEKGVTLERFMNQGEVDPIGDIEALPIDFRSPNDERLSLGRFDQLQRLFQGMNNLDSCYLQIGVACDDDITPPGQGFTHAVERFSSHDDGTALGLPLEEPEIIGKVPGKISIPADYSVLSHGGDHRNRHTAMGALM